MSDDLHITRRAFVAAGASAAAAAAIPALPTSMRAEPTRSRALAADAPFEFAEKSVDDLQGMMRSGATTAERLVEQYMERIAAMDHAGPQLHAMIEANPDARAIAASLDAERKAGTVRGPLHGIPVLVKDNLDTADRMHTSAGSLALAGSIAARDATVVAKLRAAGAVLLGKTNLSEWANFRSTHSSSGWSARGGQCRNPYALDRTPSGSSSGSGAAIAASYAAVAIGTETDGSITSPSAACSLVGLKPTVGLVSRAGIIPISHSQDTAGPMTRTVRDAAILLSAITGADDRDVATRGVKGGTDYTRGLTLDALKGKRIGVARKRYTGYSTHADAAFEDALKAMQGMGAVLVDPADIATAGQFDADEYELLLIEFKSDLAAYLATLAPGATVRTLQDLIAFNAAHAREEMPYFGQEIFEQSAKKGAAAGRSYDALVKKLRRLARTEGFDATFAKHRLDALVAPTQGPPSLIDLVNGDSGGGSSTSPCAVAGYPAVTVPMGYAHGLPLGITFMGRAWSEAALLSYAYAYEQGTKVRRAPRYLATAEL